jgi:hypothetical protein
MSEELDVRWAHVRWWLELVRRAAAEIEPLHREVDALEDARDECMPWQASGACGGGAGTHSDPTATQAMGRIEDLEGRIADARERLRECVILVGACGEVLERMRCEVDESHAEVLELYYVDRASTWSDVAHEMGVSRRAVCRLRDEAYEWVDRSAHVLL